jgi:hypothetical protein
MRAPSPTFCDQLAHVRRQVANEPDTPRRNFEISIIDRWSKHLSANEAWNTIDQAATSDGNHSLEPVEFVAWVLQKGWEHHRLANDVIPKSKALEERVISEAERNWRAARQRDFDLGFVAGIQNKLARDYRTKRLRVLGRQPNDRKIFIQACRKLFITNFAKPLDQVTELLVFVVFGTEAKANEVRDALKPSTRAGRRPRKK